MAAETADTRMSTRKDNIDHLRGAVAALETELDLGDQPDFEVRVRGLTAVVNGWAAIVNATAPTGRRRP